jgi:hypothetical protein
VTSFGPANDKSFYLEVLIPVETNRQDYEKPVASFGVILTSLLHGRFAVQVCHARGKKNSLVIEDTNTNGVLKSLLAGPAGNEGLVSIVADTVNSTDDLAARTCRLGLRGYLRGEPQRAK